MIVATLEGALMMERFVDGPAGFRDTMSALAARAASRREA